MILEMRFIISGVIVFWISYLSDGKNTSLKLHENSTLTNCLNGIIELLGKRKVSVEYSKNYEEMASDFLRKVHTPIVVNLQETHKNMGLDVRLFDDVKIILNDTAPERVLNTTLWNGDTRFFVVSEEVKIKNILEKFWKHMVINAFILVKKNKHVLVYSYEPYKGEDCKTIETILVDKYSKNKFEYNGTVFKDQFKLKNVNGCWVNVTINDAKPDLLFEGENGGNTALSIGGFEGNLMKEVAKSLNFTALYKTPNDNINWGWIRPSPHGTVGEVYKGISEFGVGMNGPLMDRFENLDISQTYNLAECVTYAVPTGLGAKKADWITIFVLEFTSVTWALITFSFVTTSINMWIISRVLNVKWFNSKTELVIYTLSSCFGAPIKIPNFKSAKIISLCWIVFCFIMTVAYKTSMGSKLTVPAQDPDIYTFNELMHLNIEINGFRTMRQLMYFKSWVYDKMRERYRSLNYSVSYALTRIADTRSEAHLRHKTTLMYYILINPKLRGRVKILDDCVIFYFPVVMLRKYSPFTNKVSQVISRLEEFGIMPMWRSKYVYKSTLESQPFYKLSLDRMIGVCIVLLFGYFVAFVAFVIELLLHFYIQRPLKSN